VLGGLPGGMPGLQSLGRPAFPGLPPFSAGMGGLPSAPTLPTAPGLQANLMRPAMPGLLRPLGVQAPGQSPIAASTSKAPSKAAGPVPPGPVAPPGPGVPPAPPLPGGAQPSAPCTVYVGRISTEVSDDFVRQLLEKCGRVSKWNRAADPNTAKLTSFGFCDFEDPQGVWRALEFLHEKQLCDKRLLVKCEEKAKQTIDKWKDSRRDELTKKKVEEPKEKEENGDASKEDGAKRGPEALTDEQLEEELRKESKDAEEEVSRLLREKNRGYPEVKPESGAEEKEEAKAPKGEKDEKGDASKEKSDEKDKDKGVSDKKEEPSSNDKGKENVSNRDRKRSPEPKLSREEERKRQREEEKRAPVSRHYRPSRRERDREQRVKDRERDIDKEYQYRIREFERNEENRIKALKRDLRDLEPPVELSDREKRKLVDRDATFGKSDLDERDWKRYREDRQRERTREIEKDNADRAAEQKEIEDERRRKEEEEQQKRKEEEERKRKEREEAEAEKRRQREEERRKKEEELRKQREELEKQREEERQKKEAEQKKQQEAAAAKLLQSVQEEMRNAGADRGPKAGPGVTPVSALFREPEELDSRGQPRKHKPLTRLDGPPPGEVKLRDDEMRRLIQQVPTDKAKAFAYDIDWQSVHDHNIIEKKLRPWVKKKVTEYLGAEEQGMIEFIMRKVASHTKPDLILSELEGFLDEEAENFTLKMWRMLIFEVLRVKAR